MNTVYKYCNEHGVCILRDLQIKVTPPNQLNDPFELYPDVICSSVPALLREHFSPCQLRARYEECRDWKDGPKSFKEFCAVVSSEKFLIKATSFIPKGDAHSSDLLAAISRRHGLLCLSSTHDSMPMWAHYAANHQGIVIAFDRSWPVFCQGMGLQNVQYGERVMYDRAWDLDSPERLSAIDRIILTKGEDWAYEQELRQLFLLQELMQAPLKNGAVGYFLSVDPSVITAVYFGIDCPATLKNDVRRVLRSNADLRHVEVFQAMRGLHGFALRFEPVRC